MTTQELTKGKRVWDGRLYRYLYFTGRECERRRWNEETNQYEQTHCWVFRDIADAIFPLTEKQIKRLVIR